MDGWALAPQLRIHKLWRTIPLIMLTARSATEDKLHALRIGVDDYLIKPFHEAELLARIDNLLTLLTQREEYQQVVHDLPEANPELALDEPNETWLASLRAVVEKLLPRFDLTLDQVAEEMAISVPHLHRKTKCLTGLTPMQLIQDLRYQQARRMLEEDPNMPIKAVSYAVGFKSEKNFARNFKKRFGIPPSVYQES